MKIVYGRCNSGHYFVGNRCPFDGWTSPQIRELSEAFERLEKQGGEVSVPALLAAGVSDEAIGRCIVVEFGNADSSFDALAVGEYFKADTRFDWAHLPLAFK
jgi:hypothetical protein